WIDAAGGELCSGRRTPRRSAMTLWRSGPSLTRTPAWRPFWAVRAMVMALVIASGRAGMGSSSSGVASVPSQYLAGVGVPLWNRGSRAGRSAGRGPRAAGRDRRRNGVPGASSGAVEEIGVRDVHDVRAFLQQPCWSLLSLVPLSSRGRGRASARAVSAGREVGGGLLGEVEHGALADAEDAGRGGDVAELGLSAHDGAVLVAGDLHGDALAAHLDLGELAGADDPLDPVH